MRPVLGFNAGLSGCAWTGERRAIGGDGKARCGADRAGFDACARSSSFVHLHSESSSLASGSSALAFSEEVSERDSPFGLIVARLSATH